MDSGNSGSMQSSSGDEEYDSISRQESVQSFLNPSSHFNPISNQNPSFLGHNQPTFFDHSSNYLQALSQSQQNSSNPNSLLNLDVVRSRGLRSDPNCTDLGNLQGSSSSTQAILASQGLSHQNQLSSMQLRSVHENNGAKSLTQSDQTNVVKNSKKRTRASRRAPTTVLTTDTSNFRQMVQEFTGIPAPPFSGSSYSRRLDLFGSGSALRSGHLEPMGPLYTLHHPSAQKVQVQQSTPFVSSASSHPLLNNNSIGAATINIASATNNNSNSITTSIAVPTTNTFNSTSSNYQLPSDLGLPKQPHNVLNMHPSQILSFQSLLQPPPPHFNNPSFNVPAFGAKSQVGLTIPSFDELGNMSQSHRHVSANNLLGLPSHADRVGSNDGRQQQDHLRAFDGNFDNTQRVNNSSCKLNFSASSSDFHHDKGLENVASRGEGTVDSWICPSD